MRVSPDTTSVTGLIVFWDRSSPDPTFWSLILQEAGQARPTQVSLLGFVYRSGHFSSYLGWRWCLMTHYTIFYMAKIAIV